MLRAKLLARHGNITTKLRSSQGLITAEETGRDVCGTNPERILLLRSASDSANWPQAMNSPRGQPNETLKRSACGGRTATVAGYTLEDIVCLHT